MSDPVLYPKGYDPTWPGAVVRCTICKRRFFAVGRLVRQTDRTICDTCFTELQLTEDGVIHAAVVEATDNANPDYYDAGALDARPEDDDE